MNKELITGLLMFLLLSNGLLAQEELASQKGNLIIGPRLVLGAVYGASFGLAGQAEYVVKDDLLDLGDGIATWLGVGGSFAYSQYSEDFFLLTNAGEFTYTNIVFLGTVFFHADVFKNPKVDPFLSFSIGTNTGSVSYNGAAGNISTPSVSGFTAGAGAGLRYYFSPKLAAVGEVGVGIGALRLGIDFKM